MGNNEEIEKALFVGNIKIYTNRKKWTECMLASSLSVSVCVCLEKEKDAVVVGVYVVVVVLRKTYFSCTRR